MMTNNVPDTNHAIRAAATCEISWIGVDGKRHATALTPLSDGEQLTVAFTFAQAEQARSLAEADTATVTITDPRSGSSTWTPLLIHGDVSMRVDLEGEIFTDTLLPEELAKYPPSRALADSIILRREHWWYLPRLLIDITPTAVEPFAERIKGQPLLFTSDRRAHVLDTNPIEVHRPTESHHIGEDMPEGPAALFNHDFSVPDMEQWTEWLATGDIAQGEFHFDFQTGTVDLSRPRGLFARFRHQAQLEKACRTALAAAGHQ
ncbi:hypothetical protein [Natronoglycomyces albus]|uniref:Uncharacterized protein n=1 Tax=Natronoglycomyces albus TaxID=2811108 RepID=A0A895XIF0_9ACTN|nr:hypothetical protein [Natronoglycomyces albus]QSB05114.1 hypothetical protein JQS30_15355 [Natronoglycomyces albus]